jgi:hypothetical protein
MSSFTRALNHLEVKEINLSEHRFTWCNGQATPTMTRIDRAFYTPDWEEFYGNPVLQALSSSSSNHCPLLLAP